MAALSGALEKGQEKVDEFVRRGVGTWVAEGHLTPERGDQLVRSLNTPAVQNGLFHAGVHFAISLPLRFPLGALARFLYTLGLRLGAELSGLARRTPPTEARRTHTALVMLFALLPGFGRLAYFFSPVLASEKLLLFIPLDQVSRKLPFRVYSRLHLNVLFVYWALDEERIGLREVLSREVRERLLNGLRAIRPYARPILAVLALDAIALGIGAFLYLDAGRPDQVIWWFREHGAMAHLDAIQLLIAAVAGIAAYRAFWPQAARSSRSESAGIFLWGIGGIGLLILAIDDYFTIHESLGHRVLDFFSFLPVVTHVPSDILIVGYATVGLAMLYVFRMELLSGKASGTLLLLAGLASAVMVLSDGFATTNFFKAFEFPAQVLASSLLMFAFVIRLDEVRQTVPAAAVDGPKRNLKARWSV
jgi:hypothetical protein